MTADLAGSGVDLIFTSGDQVGKAEPAAYLSDI
jgi:hypothetical protein